MDTFIINLPQRQDRKCHILEIFAPYPEFKLTIYNAIKDSDGAQGLFKSFCEIIKIAKRKDLAYVIICEDDHIFSKHFNVEKLQEDIRTADSINCDFLLGGPSNIHDAFFYNSQLLWLSGFTGLQFVIIYKRFYDNILSYNLPIGSAFDLELGKISNRIFSVYPMISYQKSFGYSDVTEKNNIVCIEKYFKDCEDKMNRLFKISSFYGIV